MRMTLLAAAAAVSAMAFATPSFAGMAEAEKWVDEEFQPSTLSRDEQLQEMEWFITAAQPFQGLEINVLSETIPTHEYESKVLTRAFEEITGIKVNHQLLGEGEVVQAVQTQMQTNRNLYDGYINDSDLIGTHSRLQSAINLTDWMAGEGADVTDPMLDIDDFMGKSFTTGPDGKLWQLPDQQFANLYWFRKDWFDRQDIKDAFKAKYGYDLGVPVNWSAYEDIADFFTNDVKEIDGVRVYGHMDYGKRAPDLGWRMTDAWLSMAGSGSKGCRTAVRSTSGAFAWRRLLQPRRRIGQRGGETNGPASVYAIRKWDEWLRQYAPPGAADYDFYQSLPALVRATWPNRSSGTPPSRPHGGAAEAGNNTVDGRRAAVADGALSARPVLGGRPKLGYQDAGSWTLFNSTPVENRKAAWLYAQFVVSKTVSSEEPCRSDDHPRQHINDESFTERAPMLGGWSSSIARPIACCGRRPALTSPIIRSWPSSGGSRSAT